MADGAIIPFGKPILLRDDFIDEAIFVNVLEGALARAGGVNQRIIVLMSLFQTDSALPFGAFYLWIVWHISYINDSSISLFQNLSIGSYSKSEPFSLIINR